MNPEKTKRFDAAGKYGLVGLLSIFSMIGAFALVGDAAFSLLIGAGAAMLSGWYEERINQFHQSIIRLWRWRH